MFRKDRGTQQKDRDQGLTVMLWIGSSKDQLQVRGILRTGESPEMLPHNDHIVLGSPTISYSRSMGDESDFWSNVLV